MDRATFETYLARFNAEDATAFDDYLCADMTMLNGALRFEGVQGMKDHYQKLIWPHFVEKLNLIRFIGNGQHVAIELRTDFTARGDRAETLFGPVAKGEMFVYRGLIMYDLRDGKFATITVSYNSFTNIKTDGTRVEMGLPH
jgi:hypothetical protein